MSGFWSDLLFCLVLPSLYIPLGGSTLLVPYFTDNDIDLPVYTVQSGRYVIEEQIGCAMLLSSNWLALTLSNALPLVPSLCSIVYIRKGFLSFRNKTIDSAAAFIINAVRKTTRELAEVDNSIQLIPRNNYMKLLLLSIFDLLFTLPANLEFFIYVLVLSWPRLTNRAEDSLNWKVIHAHFSRVLLVPAPLWRQVRMSVIEVYYQVSVNFLFSLAFFVFFGTSEEMRRNYRTVVHFVCRNILKAEVSGGALTVQGDIGFATGADRISPRCDMLTLKLLYFNFRPEVSEGAIFTGFTRPIWRVLLEV